MTKISHKHGKGYVVEDKGNFFYFKTIQEAMAKALEIDNKNKKQCKQKVTNVLHIYNIVAILQTYTGKGD